MSSPDDVLNIGSSRIRRLTQAALNVDVTLGQIEDIAREIGSALDYFDTVLRTFDGTLDKFGGTLDSLGESVENIDTVVGSLAQTQAGVDELLGKAGDVVDTVGWVLAPVTAARRVCTDAAGLLGAGLRAAGVR